VIGVADVTYSGALAKLRTFPKDESREIDLGGLAYDNEEVIQLMRRLPLADGYKVPCASSPAWAAATSFPCKSKSPERKRSRSRRHIRLLQGRAGQVQSNPLVFHRRPHYLVKFEGGGVIGVLTSVTQRKAGDPAPYLDPLLNFSLAAPADWLFFRTDAKDEKDKVRVIAVDPEAIGTSIVNVGSRKSLWPEAQNSLRAWADKEIADGEGSKVLKELTVRPESWKDRPVAGRPGLSFVGDFVDGKEKKIGYAVFTFGRPMPRPSSCSSRRRTSRASCRNSTRSWTPIKRSKPLLLHETPLPVRCRCSPSPHPMGRG